ARARRNLAHLRRDRPGRQLHRQLPEPVRSRDPRGGVQRAAGAPAEESDGDHRPALSRATSVPYGVCYPRVAGARPREEHMAEQVVIVEKTEGVAILTLNRPEQLNAMNAQLGAELREAVARMTDDDEVGCIVITGAGKRAFSAGGDIHEQRED